MNPPLQSHGATDRLVARGRGVDFTREPAHRQAQIRRLLVDGVGVLLAGMGQPTPRLLAAHVESLGAQPTAAVWGTNVRTSPQEAAFVLGTAIHALDFEPVFDPPTYVVSPVLGALLALVEPPGAGPPEDAGRRFLSCFAAGIQLQVDLRRASVTAEAAARAGNRSLPVGLQGGHRSGTIGAMGSALSVALWLGLDRQTTRVALDIAASRASCTSGHLGSMTHATHCGHAARIGVESALLARRGLTATDDFLRRPGGGGLVPGADSSVLEVLARGSGALDAFEQTGFAFKRWPTHTAIQFVIEAGLRLRRPGAPPPSHLLLIAPVTGSNPSRTPSSTPNFWTARRPRCPPGPPKRCSQPCGPSTRRVASPMR
jgi:aconitate decarboxylase